MKRITYRSVLTLVVAGFVLAAAPNAIATHRVGAPVASRAQASPTFVFPSSGQTFPLNGSMLFQVQPVSRAQGYLWSFVQNGAVVWQNLAWDGRLSGATYSVGKGSRAEGHMHGGDMQVWVRAWMGGNQWSGLSTLTVRLQGAASGPAQPQPVQPTHPAPGTTLFFADTSGGLDKMTGTSDWGHVNGMLVNNGSASWDRGSSSYTSNSWLPMPYPARGTNNYAIEADIQVVKPNGEGEFGVSVRHGSRNDYNGHVIYCCENPPAAGIDYVDYGSGRGEGLGNGGADKTFDPGTDWHTYRLEVSGNQLRFLIDGGVFMTASDNRILTGGVAGLFCRNVQLTVRRIRVTAL